MALAWGSYTSVAYSGSQQYTVTKTGCTAGSALVIVLTGANGGTSTFNYIIEDAGWVKAEEIQDPNNLWFTVVWYKLSAAAGDNSATVKQTYSTWSFAGTISFIEITTTGTVAYDNVTKNSGAFSAGPPYLLNLAASGALDCASGSLMLIGAMSHQYLTAVSVTLPGGSSYTERSVPTASPNGGELLMNWATTGPLTDELGTVQCDYTTYTGAGILLSLKEAAAASTYGTGTGMNRGLRRGMDRHIGRLTV